MRGRLGALAGLALAVLYGCAERPLTLQGLLGGGQGRPIPTTPAPAAPILAPTPPAPPVPPPVQPPPPRPEVTAAAPAEGVRLVPPPGAGAPFKVALLLPLSGPAAAIGNSFLEAAQLAVLDLADDRFVLLPYDSTGTPAGAARAGEAAIAEGAKLILGPLFGAEASAVRPAARNAGVSVISFSNDQSVAGDGIFVMGFLPQPEVQRVTQFAIRRGIKRFAVFAPRDALGNAAAEALKAVAERERASVAKIEMYDPALPDLAPLVRRFADYDRRHSQLPSQRPQLTAPGQQTAQGAGDLGFDALLVPEAGEKLKALAPLFPANDIDPRSTRLLGLAPQWDDASLAAEPALKGGWYAAPPPELRSDFEARFEAAFRHPPPRLATLAYDATALAAVLAKLSGAPDFSADTIAQDAGFAGLDGIFRFRRNGLNERGFAILEIGDRERHVIDPAPETFQPVTN
ncbi:MAG: penicillin-binding protein activator [Proteobacteria bacterium]|nr:penicillin-binding protein activator [Pseudomonadota bacterium]